MKHKIMGILAGVAMGMITVGAQNFQTDQRALLDGVKEVAAPGWPGIVSVFGLNAFPVVAGRVNKEVLAPAAAGARLGKGRIVAFGHNGYLGPDTHADTPRLLVNAVRWLGNGAEPAKIRVAVIGQAGLLKFLRTEGFAAEAVRGGVDAASLRGFQVVCSTGEAMRDDAGLKALEQLIRDGGGWLAASTGWGWLQLHPGQSLTVDHPGNRLLMHAGLAWADGGLDPTVGKGFSTTNTLNVYLNATSALDALLNTNLVARMSNSAIAQAAWTLSAAARALPADDKLILPRLNALKSNPQFAVPPTADKPLRSKDALARLVLTLQILEAQAAKPEAVRAHPAAVHFPGSPPADARRLTDEAREINTAVPGWHSLGLYAAPGELVRVTVPESAIGKKLRLRIGCHTDGLWSLDRWSRAPEITRSVVIGETVATLANAFGGLVYVEVPDRCDLGRIAVKFSGVIPAPLFELGKTTREQWQQQRSLPGPWAELATDKLILTVPNPAARELDDPEALMKFWDRVMDAIADLATIPRERKRPERIVCDQQISAGYMHSGYPIMTHLDVQKSVLDLARLSTKGSWGHFHELGHNHQNGDWTFDGTGEVTVNLFSLYVCEKVSGLPGGLGHDAVQPATVERRLKKYVADGAKFETWKSDPFLALTMYMQLRDGFGWDTFKKVFAEYRKLEPGERPRGDAAERDQWMVRFSKAAGKNLGPFFEAWGVPTSEDARRSIKDLPAWMPLGFPGK